MSLKFSTAESNLEGKRVNGALAELGNAVIAFFWEGDEPLLGTLTATLPSKMSTPLLGDRDQLLGQIIGEQLTNGFGKIALVSTNLHPVADSATAKMLLELVKKMMSSRKT